MRTNIWHVVVLEDQLVNWKMYADIIMQALKKSTYETWYKITLKVNKFELIKSLLYYLKIIFKTECTTIKITKQLYNQKF